MYRDPSPRTRRRVKRRESPEGMRQRVERARRKGTPTSEKITIFAYVNYRLTRMNERPRYFRPPVDSHQIDCLEEKVEAVTWNDHGSRASVDRSVEL